MSDFLLNLSRSQIFRKVVKTAGLPVPLPTILERASGPWKHETLQAIAIFVTGLRDKGRYPDLLNVLQDAGAVLAGSEGALDGCCLMPLGCNPSKT